MSSNRTPYPCPESIEHHLDALTWLNAARTVIDALLAGQADVTPMLISQVGRLIGRAEVEAELASSLDEITA